MKRVLCSIPVIELRQNAAAPCAGLGMSARGAAVYAVWLSVGAAIEFFAYPKATDDQCASDDADGGDRFVDDEICRNHGDHGLEVHVIVGGDSAEVSYAQRP